MTNITFDCCHSFNSISSGLYKYNDSYDYLKMICA